MSEPSYATKTEAPRLPVSSALRIRDERLVSLQALAGQLAHDFNNFLAPILGYVSLIKEEVTPDTPARQYAESIERAARKTEASLETIILAARPQRQHRPKKIDFTQLVDRVLTEWTQSLPPTCLITVSRQLEPCTLILDEAQWRVVLQQLLHNSHYALATGGALSVTVKTETLPPARAADLGLPANPVCLSLPPGLKTKPRASAWRLCTELCACMEVNSCSKVSRIPARRCISGFPSSMNFR